MGSVTFTSPTMRARAGLVRALDQVDAIERAWYGRDFAAVERLASELRETMAGVAEASEAMGPDRYVEPIHAVTAIRQAEVRPNLDDAAAEPTSAMSESELRSAYGDR